MNKKLKNFIKINTIILLISSTMTCRSFNNNSFADENRNVDDLTGATISEFTYLKSLEISKRDTLSFNKIAYITFDDGPSKYTGQIISILNRYNAKATFFMIDSNMKKYPEQVNNIIENGNTPGFHSVSHDIHKLYKTNLSAKEEFDINSETFYKITGENTKIIRLPYGSKPYTPKDSYEALVEAGYKMWDWDIDTQDWKSNSVEIVDNVAKYSQNKDEIVILMHEKSQTVEALDSILKLLIEEGYVFLPISQDQEPQNFWSGNLK